MKKNYLLIISCSDRKVSKVRQLAAIDLYDGPTYRTLRKFLRKNFLVDTVNLNVRIISAKHGLITSTEQIAPYDQKMTPQRATELQLSVQETLDTLLQTEDYEQVFINLGKIYRRTLEGFHWGLVSTVEASGGIGLKTQQMKAWLERIYEGEHEIY